MEIAILLFDQLTALDAIGPYEVLGGLPGARLRYVGHERGTVRTDHGLGLMVDAALDEVDAPDILVVPGGWGTRALEQDDAIKAWIRRVHERTTWTTSVCTGSIVLAAAGLLTDQPATTHWSQGPEIEKYGARFVKQRFVETGKIVTAAGVSAGIDMALHLVAKIAGDQAAQAIQLGIEYDPQPPFDAGSIDKAPKPVVDMLLALFAQRQSS